MTSVIRGLNLGPERLAAIRHATAFDDQLARARIQINQARKQCLHTDYAAAPKPVVVHENIYPAIKNNLRNAIESGTYQVGKARLPSNFTDLGQAPTRTSEPPKWKDTDYTICHPPGFELPTLQTEIELW